MLDLPLVLWNAVPHHSVIDAAYFPAAGRIFTASAEVIDAVFSLSLSPSFDFGFCSVTLRHRPLPPNQLFFQGQICLWIIKEDQGEHLSNSSYADAQPTTTTAPATLQQPVIARIATEQDPGVQPVDYVGDVDVEVEPVQPGTGPIQVCVNSCDGKCDCDCDCIGPVQRSHFYLVLAFTGGNISVRLMTITKPDHTGRDVVHVGLSPHCSHRLCPHGLRKRLTGSVAQVISCSFLCFCSCSCC